MLLRRIGKILLWALAGVVVIVLVFIGYVQARWDAPSSRVAPQMSAPRDSATVARGEYIYKYQARCWSCHATGHADATTPPTGGMVFDLSTAGPGFGVWRARNITPDVATGLGAWSDGEIVQAIREGIRKDRTVMFPIMPNDWFKDMADADVLAVVAYLRSLPPVAHEIPPQEPSFVAKALFTFGVLKPQPAVTAPITAPPAGETVAYGKYLASALAGCLDCHTPRNLEDGQFYLDSLGAGSSFAFGEAENAPFLTYARNITPDKETGIGSWTEAQFMAAVTTGMRPDGTVLDPIMPYAHYKASSEEDLRAIHVYLRSLPAMPRTTPPRRSSAAYTSARGAERGAILFQGRCATCHGFEGGGAVPTRVQLAGVAASLSDAELKEMIRTGDVNLKMPSFGATLAADELDDLVAHIRSWKQP
jgi:mono/diheme cytochrome c family protein